MEFPAWITADTSLVILGILAFTENRATKSPEIAELLSTFDNYVKAFGELVFGSMALTTGSFAIAGSLTVVHAGFDAYSLPPRGKEGIRKS